MGFGLLLIGYFMTTLMSMNTFGSVFRLVGYLIIGLSAAKLRKYNRNFDWMLLMSVVMVGIYGVLSYITVTDWLYREMLISSGVVGETVKNTLGYVEMALSLLFHTAMQWAIRAIAVEVEMRVIAVRAIRNFIVMLFYYLLSAIAYIPFPFQEAYNKYAGLPVLLIYIFWMILNLILIFSCYAGICDESDREMRQKPSRFAFVNRMREAQEERNAQAQKRAEEYRREKVRKKEEKRKNGK